MAHQLIPRRLPVAEVMTLGAKRWLQKRWCSVTFHPRFGHEAAWAFALVFITFCTAVSCVTVLSSAVAPAFSVLLSMTAGPSLGALLAALVIRTHKKASVRRYERRVSDPWVERVAAGDVQDIASAKRTRQRWEGTVAAGAGPSLNEQGSLVARCERRIFKRGSFYASRAWVPFIVDGDDFRAIVMAESLYLSSPKLSAFGSGTVKLSADDNVAVIACARPLLAGSVAEQCWNELAPDDGDMPHSEHAQSSDFKPRLVLESTWLRPVLCRLQGTPHSPPTST